MVGVSPGVSEEEAEDGDVSAPDDELIELMVFFTAPEAISLRGIDLAVPPESMRLICGGELLDSIDFLDSNSSLILESWEDRGVDFSALSICLGESVRGMLDGPSLRGGADKPPDPDRELLLSLISDCEFVLEVPDFFPLGTSPKRNFSLPL
tara:strand:+ start:1122 stop:1577 length:456 start_codon:yes stop_codon:yes gene_type:complete